MQISFDFCWLAWILSLFWPPLLGHSLNTEGKFPDHQVSDDFPLERREKTLLIGGIGSISKTWVRIGAKESLDPIKNVITYSL